jgi:hypothetical protein
VTAHGIPIGPLQFDRLEDILDRQMYLRNSWDFVEARPARDLYVIFLIERNSIRRFFGGLGIGHYEFFQYIKDNLGDY